MFTITTTATYKISAHRQQETCIYIRLCLFHCSFNVTFIYESVVCVDFHIHVMALFALFIAFLLFIPLSFFIWIRQKKLIVSKYDENKKLLHLNDYPILGASLRLMGDGEEMYAEMLKLADRYRNHGMFVLQMGMEPWLIIFQADFMQKILSGSKHLDKNRGYDFLHPWLRYGLLTR